MTTRNWSIRTKIVALVTVPLVALLALWIFATSLTIGPAFNLLGANTLLDTVGRPGETLVGELQRERRLSVIHLSGEDASPRGALVSQRAATDRAIADFRAAAGSDDAQSAAGDTLRDRIRQMFADLDGLAANRSHIDNRQMDVIGAQHMYNSIVSTGFAMFAALARFGDEQVDREIRALTTVGRGQEYLSRADSLLAGGVTAGELDRSLRDDLLESILTSRFLLTEGVADMAAEERTAYQRMRNSPAFTRLDQLQDTLITESRTGEAPPVAPEDWRAAYDTAAQQLRAFELNATEQLAGRAMPVAVTMVVRLALTGLLGLVALVVSIIVSVRLGRSIIGRLRTLRGEALELAGARLPEVVRRLRRGEPVDVEAETPPLEYGDDEIGEVGHAFTDVQRTAVQSAVDEAAVRKGINEVFLNIARRSQTLLHRQLALLDRMERRETEPDELEDLYRVDHLATRMRRHAEDLVILAGAAPGRGWRNPVPVVDVIRGAISEVEDYKRIDIPQVDQAAVVGRAVGDVIHLVAELLENAASFSPPTTRVTVIGQELPNGYALEIEDRGLGMSAESIEEANRRLVEPPDFDLKDSARLGLFVVSRLARRTGVKVSLRQSAYGGVTAVVLIPAELMTTAPNRPAALPAGPSGIGSGGIGSGGIGSGGTGPGGTGPGGTGPGGPIGPGGSGRTPDSAWDRPMLGTGRNDPERRNPASLQWSGDGKRGAASDPDGSTVPLSRRPTGNGSFASPPVPRPRTAPEDTPSGPPASHTPAGHTGPAPSGLAPAGPAPSGPAPSGPAPSGPAPSSLADGLSPEGLVRRRRRTMPRTPEAKPSAPATEAKLAAAAPEPGLSTRDGLPKRVRQASLAPQLRDTPPDVDAGAPTRSPEQIRMIMSALQQGTNRGRQEAAAGPAVGPAAAPDASSGTAQSFAEAATVHLPVVRDDTKEDDA